jgi:hypothetical protein
MLYNILEMFSYHANVCWRIWPGARPPQLALFPPSLAMPLVYNSKGWMKNDLVVNIVTHVYSQYKDQKRGVSASACGEAHLASRLC